MAGAQPAPIFAPAVSWSGEAIRKLRTLAVDGLLALPQRGMETGGLLLGSVSERAPFLFSIEDVCPIPCEHRFGPGFTLSDADHEALRDQLASARACGEHCVIGFFRTRTGPGASTFFDEADRDLVDNYFDDPSHIFLALHPRSLTRCEAAVYFWTGGRLTTTGRVCELSELTLAAGPGEPPPERAPEPEPQPSFMLETAPQPRRPSITMWFVGVLCGLALGGFLVVHYRDSGRTLPEPEPPEAAAVPSPPPAAPEPQAQPQPQAELPPEAEPVARRALSLEAIRPGVPESIAARLTEPVHLILRVDIDETGHVTSARPAEYSDGMRRYLAQRAAEAARAARFRPAESASGRPLPSTETITVTVHPAESRQ
jgi:hypothetical protein